MQLHSLSIPYRLNASFVMWMSDMVFVCELGMTEYWGTGLACSYNLFTPDEDQIVKTKREQQCPQPTTIKVSMFKNHPHSPHSSPGNRTQTLWIVKHPRLREHTERDGQQPQLAKQETCLAEGAEQGPVLTIILRCIWICNVFGLRPIRWHFRSIAAFQSDSETTE